MSLVTLNTEPEYNQPQKVDAELVAEPGMEQRIAWCNELDRQANDALARAWQIGVVLGWELCRLKESVQHGEFGKFFRTDENDSKLSHGYNFNFSHISANKYMTLYRRCLNYAELQEAGEDMYRLLEDYAATRTPEAAERLSLAFNRLAPEARSMRSALLEFMRQEPEFTKRNDKGQIKALPSAEAQVKASTMELESLAQKLNELLESGRYTLAEEGARKDMEAVCRAMAQKLALVK